MAPTVQRSVPALWTGHDAKVMLSQKNKARVGTATGMLVIGAGHTSLGPERVTVVAREGHPDTD